MRVEVELKKSIFASSTMLRDTSMHSDNRQLQTRSRKQKVQTTRSPFATAATLRTENPAPQVSSQAWLVKSRHYMKMQKMSA
jgi:hypothetical protein